MTCMQVLFDKKRQLFYTFWSVAYDMGEHLGDRIRKVRKRYGMPAAVLAKRVEISRQQLYMIEHNETENPGALTVLRIADAVRVSTDYLLKGKRKTRPLLEGVESELFPVAVA